MFRKARDRRKIKGSCCVFKRTASSRRLKARYSKMSLFLSPSCSSFSSQVTIFISMVCSPSLLELWDLVLLNSCIDHSQICLPMVCPNSLSLGWRTIPRISLLVSDVESKMYHQLEVAFGKNQMLMKLWLYRTSHGLWCATESSWGM